MPSPTRVTSVPPRPPLVAVPMPWKARGREPHLRDTLREAPHPPPRPLSPPGGGSPTSGRGGKLEADPTVSNPTAAPHTPPLPAVWSRPLSTNQSSPLKEEGVICISACRLALPTVPLVEIYRGPPRRPIQAHAARDAPPEGEGLRQQQPVGARVGRAYPGTGGASTVRGGAWACPGGARDVRRRRRRQRRGPPGLAMV